jgi:hypothetical protein
MNNLKKTAVAAAVATTLGMTATTASADVISADFTGWFTMINAGGTDALVNGDASTQAFYGRRTAVSGDFVFDTDTGAGSADFTGFSFFGSGLAIATTISFQAIGDGVGGPGSLVLGNMGFNWNGNNGIPVSIVMDAAGFFGAVAGGLTTSDNLSGGGVVGATEGFLFDFGKFSYTLPMGPTLLGTTTFNTTNIGSPGLGDNPSGTLPLSDDGIGGSPMPAGPFPGFNANFDILTAHITNVDTGGPAVPVPAAVWLFGSGLLGLVGVARRRKSA